MQRSTNANTCPLTVKCKTLRQRLTAASKCISFQWPQISLLFHCIIAIIAAIVLLFVAFVILNHLSPAADGETLIPLIHEAFLLVGGLAGTIYLIVAYRKQRHQEMDHRDIRFNRALESLHSPKPLDQAHGVRNLIALADTRPNEYAKDVVAALCGFMRLTSSNDGRRPDVERLILTTLRDHLSNPCNQRISWRDYEIDLQGTVFKQRVSLNDCTCMHLNLHDCVFEDDFDARFCTFYNVDFFGASFRKRADFENATFNDEVRFGSPLQERGNGETTSTFAGKAVFSLAKFRADCDFGRGKSESFSYEGDTEWATRFEDEAFFDGAKFSGDCSFENCIFDKGAQFCERRDEDNNIPTTFEGSATFTGCQLGRAHDDLRRMHASIFNFRKAEFKDSIKMSEFEHVNISCSIQPSLESTSTTNEHASWSSENERPLIHSPVPTSDADNSDTIPVDKAEDDLAALDGSDANGNASIAQHDSALISTTTDADTSLRQPLSRFADFTDAKMLCSQHRGARIKYYWGTLTFDGGASRQRVTQLEGIPLGTRCMKHT